MYAMLLLAGLLLSTAGLAQPPAKTFTFAAVPQYDARSLYSTWQPILEYLEGATGYHFVLESSSDIPSFEKHLSEGAYDFAYANPLQYLLAARSQGYSAVLRDGNHNLQGIVVVPRGSRIQTIEQLHGQPIAFPAPNALGATMLVRYELEKLRGVKFEPHYVKTHNSAYLQVATGRFPAAGGVLSTFMQQLPAVRQRLHILYRTGELKPHPIAAHPRVGAEAMKKFRNAFISLAQSEKGRKLLASIPLTQPTIASSEDYQTLENYKLVEFKAE
jgi:phosphonate transport system substrate-binding protein